MLLLPLLLMLACDGQQEEDRDTGVSGRADTGPPKDAGAVQRDAEPADALPEDADLPDADLTDAGLTDADLPEDAGEPDAGDLDAGEPDAGLAFTLLVATTSTGGAVFSSPGAIACTDPPAGPCQDVFTAGSQVTLTASAAADFAFDRWTGDCAGGPSAVLLTMDADRTCTAHFIGTAGEIALVPPPLSVIPNDTEDAFDILIFREQTDLTVPPGQPLDIHLPDVHTTFPAPFGELPAGLLVNVYFVHFDPVGTAGLTRRQARLFFPERIVGFIARSASLDQADSVLGLPSTVTYPAPGAHTARGLELDGIQDVLTLEDDRRHVVLDFETSNSSDQFRIVTLATPGAPFPLLFIGEVGPIAPPPSVVLNQLQSSTTSFAFIESSGLTLAAPLDVDVTAPGSYTNQNNLSAGTIPAGTQIRSWMIHFDPTTSRTIDGAITFQRDILGLILESTPLDTSDLVVGSSSTAYPAPGTDPDRRMELADDPLFLSGDRRSIRFRMRATTGIDQLRVILAD